MEQERRIDATLCNIRLVDHVKYRKPARRYIDSDKLHDVIYNKCKAGKFNAEYIDGKIMLDADTYAQYKKPIKINVSNFFASAIQRNRRYKGQVYKAPYFYYNCKNDEDMKNAEFFYKHLIKFVCSSKSVHRILEKYTRVVFADIPLHNFPDDLAVEAVKKRIINIIFPLGGNGERKSRISNEYAKTLYLCISKSYKCNDITISIYSKLNNKIAKEVLRDKRKENICKRISTY